MDLAPDSKQSSPSMTVRQGFRAPFQVQTYKNLLYLALAFPLGIVYFVGLALGVLGVGLLITWVGLPILLVTLLAATAVAGFEAALARHLGGVDASVPTFLTEFDVSGGLVVPGNGFVDAVKRLVRARTTWTSVVLVLAKFGFGLFSFVALTTSGAVTGAFLAAPFIYDDPDVILGVGGLRVDGEYTVGPWAVDTFPEALVAALVGVVVLFVALNLLNSLAQFHAQYTARLLKTDK
ncbi:sensor protein [Halobellus sp. Atlit-38R]|uniref:sensor domain-containing protein n=1 Tax=Halobellus sp. Atlit-38R TaxID=2282131 RepID=UPI000EF23A21|nr:sensor domain-containing protein [Halobellus sp. Atlit-38R]RLM84259.1 sensor protein [Halobellus sp. Atlit-38R]